MEQLKLTLGDAEFHFVDSHIPLTVMTDWEAEVHSHLFYEFHFITDHWADVHLLSDVLRVKKGQCLILAPGCPHYVERASGVRDVSFLLQLIKRTGEGEGEYAHYSDRLSRVSPYAVVRFSLPMLRALTQYPPETWADFFLRKDYELRFSQLLSDILRKISVDALPAPLPTPVLSAEELLARRKYQIEMYFDDTHLRDASLPELCSLLCLAPKQTERVIKAATGETFRKHLCRLRMERAKYLFTVKHLTPETVYSELGYSSVTALRAAFRTAYGVTPENIR